MARSSYDETVLKKGPVAYWRLGKEHGPEAADASGNGHHGTYHGKPAFGERGAITGDPDTAIGLAPPDSYVEIPSSLQFSVLARRNPRSLHFYIMWLGKGEIDEMEWAFRFYSHESTRPNRISVYVWNADGGLGAGGSIFKNGPLRVRPRKKELCIVPIMSGHARPVPRYVWERATSVRS